MPSTKALVKHVFRRVPELRKIITEAVFRIRVLDAPLQIAIRGAITKHLSQAKAQNSVLMDEWLQFRDQYLTHSTDWFSMRVPAWVEVLQKLGLRDKPLRVLEIGSWEGLSASFVLRSFESTITCVDTWAGSDEHSNRKDLDVVEKNFDQNLSLFGERFNKIRSTSAEFFRNYRGDCFDLIYVDGSHHFSDVLSDAFAAHEVLAPSGLMIFDDYDWRVYDNVRDNPARAINIFMAHMGRSYKVIRVGYQLFVQKKA